MTAQLNPGKGFTVDKSVPWSKQVTNQNDAPALEFTHAEPKNLSIELLFDTYEGGNLQADYIEKLEFMTTVGPEGHPPKVLFQWGKFKFNGAIESLNVSYTMFKEDGTACRASVNVKMKEAESVSKKDTGGGGANTDKDMKEKGRSGVPEGGDEQPGFPLTTTT